MRGLSFLFVLLLNCWVQNSWTQTLIINEFSNGPSGSQEYVEFVVVDNTVVYDCNNTTPPCIDIRGWIFDDNSGYHGTNGQAQGAVRFNNNPIWSCVPVGTIILVYNGGDPNGSIPADDLSLADGNCSLVIDLENQSFFEFTETTPGAATCSYPTTGWGADPSPTWSNVGMSNSGDCARIVDLNGCEVFSVCYGSCSSNPLIYFAGSGSDQVWNFNDGDPYDQSNWTAGCAGDIASCGSNDQTPGAPNNLANQNYIAQFNNNCQPITPLVSSASVNLPIICGCSNSATASATGSIPGYTYTWYDDAFVAIGQTNATATNLCPGTYNVIISSSINCIDTSQVVITGSGAVAAGDDNTIDLCDNATALDLFDEIIGVPNTGGTWQGPSILANADQGTFDPITDNGGIYQYIVFGSGGCPNDTAFITVNLNTATNAGVGTTLDLCSNNPSEDLFDQLTGSPQSTGVWTGPSALSNGNSGSFDPVSNLSGNYLYVVNGSGVCPNDTAIVVVTVSSAPDAGSDNTHGLCEDDGTIDLYTILGGSPNSGGSWSPALTSGTGLFDPLTDATGVYTYTIIGGGPCLSSSAEIDVTVYQTPNVTETISHVSCNGAADASVDLTILPSVGNTVVWTLPTLNTVTQEDIGPVSEGNYSYEVTSADGCTYSNAVTLNQPLALNLTLNVTQQSCPGACDGEILASCTNGVGTVTFSLNGSAFGVGSFTGLCDGNINITAMDANGCQVTTNTLMGAVNPSAEPNINPMASLCESGNVVNLTADIAGGTWSGLGVTNNQTGTFDPQQVGAGVYNVIYTIAGFCGGDDTIAINVVNDPIGAIELSDTLGCLPLSVNLSNPLSDASNASCIWTISNGDVINSCNAANYNFTSPGCYDVSLTITNTGGCTATFNALQQVCVLDAPDASFTSNAIIFEEGASIFNGVANDVTGETYQWYFSDLSISNTIDASHDLDGLGAGEYSICLSVGNQGGCSDSVCEIVTFVENFSIYIPNTFTPNGDGINELFFPVFYSALPENFEFLIFNRWGQLIFQSKEIDAIWDGTYNGSLAPEDVYIWKINYTLFNETGTNRQTGHVNLVR